MSEKKEKKKMKYANRKSESQDHRASRAPKSRERRAGGKKIPKKYSVYLRIRPSIFPKYKCSTGREWTKAH